MPKPKLTGRELSFDFLLPRKPALRVKEVCSILALRKTTVEELMTDGQLWGHEHNGRANRAKRDKQLSQLPRRMTATICRESLQLYLIRTATYDADMKRQAALEALATFDAPEDLLLLRNFLQRRLDNLPAQQG